MIQLYTCHNHLTNRHCCILIEALSLLSSPGKMIGEQYKMIGIAPAETIHHKRDLWTFIEWSLRMKKDILRHLVKTESMWMDPFRFELKCTPRYLTVGELGGCVFWIKEAFRTFSGQHSRLQGDEGLYPNPLDQYNCCKNCKRNSNEFFCEMQSCPFCDFWQLWL